jgi:hypothetical protein
MKPRGAMEKLKCGKETGEKTKRSAPKADLRSRTQAAPADDKKFEKIKNSKQTKRNSD